MAPSLIGLDNRLHPEGEESDDYDKELEKAFKCTSAQMLHEFFHVSDDTDLFRLSEYRAQGAYYPYYVVGELLESIDPAYQATEVRRLKTAGESPSSIATQIEALKLHVGQPVTQVFRVAYTDLSFIDKAQNPAICKQIRGVYTQPEYQGARLASTVYSYLIDKYTYLACDHMQTILGATLWAISMRKRGTVEIYDTTNACFIEELGNGAVGVRGFVPWDIGSLPQFRAGEWFGTNLEMTPMACQHIINIVTKRS